MRCTGFALHNRLVASTALLVRRATAGGLLAALAACSSPAAHRPAPEHRVASPTAHPGAAPSIVSAPVRIARTARGAVGYRVVGAGPPVVLIMGYTGTMENWDPRFVDALAESHQVVIFDNAGIGRTAPLPRPVTIDAMADQTAALLAALGLRRPDVVGWSMGGMVAQALAAAHPAQVRRLVLCATYPGIGAVPPSRGTISALAGGTLQGLISDLFPADQAAAFAAYASAIARYPAHPFAPAATAAAQARAIGLWWAGADPAGRLTARILAPTLIADGAADRLVPVANDHALARLIPRSRLALFPDAGHAFLFQEGPRFVALVESFLSGAG